MLNSKISFLVLFFLIAPTTDFAQSNLESLVTKCKKTVVTITTYDKSNKVLSSGTGFFIDAQGICVSNYHVLEGAQRAEVKTISGKIYPINNIISQSEKMDLIKFSIANPNNYIFPFLMISQNKAKEGENVFVIGNPKGLEFSVSNGIVSSLRNDEKLGQLIQTTAPISSGNSGSPLINMKGEAIGVISFTLLDAQNLNFAISIASLFLLDEVGELKFPPAKEIKSNSNESQFKRFDWKTSSAQVLASETLTLVEQKTNLDGGLTLVYSANIAGIELQIDYDFKFDQLIRIYFVPIRRHPLTMASDKRKGRYNLTSFNTAYNEFATIESKLLNLVGKSYGECIGGIRFFCKDDDFVTTRSALIGKSEINSIVDGYFNEEIGDGFGYPSCHIFHRWINEGNQSEYVLNFESEKEARLLNGQEWQCDWSLIVRSLE